MAKRRILIVEDDEALRRFYKIALRSAGFETEEAADGITALHLIDQQPPPIWCCSIWISQPLAG